MFLRVGYFVGGSCDQDSASAPRCDGSGLSSKQPEGQVHPHPNGTGFSAMGYHGYLGPSVNPMCLATSMEKVGPRQRLGWVKMPKAIFRIELLPTKPSRDSKTAILTRRLPNTYFNTSDMS